MNPIYFLEGETAGADAVARRGLECVLEKGMAAVVGDLSLPGGESRRGLFATMDRGVDTALLKRMKWECLREITGLDSHGGVWIGLDETLRPSPVELARREMLDGYGVKLGDGNVYTIPKALAYYRVGEPPAMALPGAVLMRGGKWVKVLREKKLQRLHLLALSLTEAVMQSGAVVFDSDLAAEVLGLNYRIGVGEVSLLQLFCPDRVVVEIIEAFCDKPGAARLLEEKKMGPAVVAGGPMG